MAKQLDIPSSVPLVEGFTQPQLDENFNGLPRLQWILFFQRLLSGDKGSFPTITPVNLTFTGTPTITSGYYQNQGFTDFWIRIQPGTNTSSTAGSTYFTLPFDVLVDGACVAVTPPTGATLGTVDANTNRVYPPSWSNITVPITISGRVQTA